RSRLRSDRRLHRPHARICAADRGRSARHRAAARHALHVRRPRRDDLRAPRHLTRRTSRHERSTAGGAMRNFVIAVGLLAATRLAAQIPVARVAADANVIDRVAEASTNDLPRDLLKRIVNEDIDLLRGKRADGTYQYAAYDRMEAGRKSDSFSVDPEHKESVLELRDVFPYRLIVNVPSRRMMVAKNHHIYIDRIEIETLPQ